MDIKIVHTSDLHLGSTFKVLGSKSKLHRIDCQNVLTNIIDLCIKEKVKALLIGGDLFDTAEPQKSLVKFVISEFERLNKEKITVFISSGNHDPHKNGSVWLAYRFPSNVIIFDSSDLEAKEIDGLTVYGLAYIDDTKEPLKGFKANDFDNFKIGLIHGSIIDINWEEEPEKGYRRITTADLNNCKLDYVALGHFHDTLEIKSKTKCFYSGTPEPLTFKNKKDCSIILASYNDGNVTIRSIKTNIREFETLEIDCTNFESDSGIRKIIEKNKDKNKALRLVLKGLPSLDLNLDIELLLKEFDENYFLLKIVDNIHLPENLIEDETIRGNLIRLIKAEIGKEKDSEKKKRLENALRIGVGHLDKKL
ncbi:MAG: phosphoesterase [Candidatus Methanoperedens nitroreducens]|uniref:Phosphoesterase n=1 Tax=Candidatus Methanoperedens nitratireducens TaxID=1392998 RepID=A0A0P8ACB4_9EURY|nr:DNA repair exonuclease [Candidatus Methanoperedens sp. BLZ2]KAB2944782.1 MAG: DNA repair exonuclease [Candidatus Methanoperedens sp.]KPQ41717.1 MAG: phosphoesterase [Candidatus Methanoperedens sp. BLZ1]MBZ0177071.1 DNA repair exonuclease [Candidatus Methanoperedens nitroreducens]CAG0975519.1 putative metallophosphoesterase YhaO [Methanosarcinales archaeon]MCX9077502.1 DNA repair exonuclease [Candidatus Methanoperedens sp.]